MRLIQDIDGNDKSKKNHEVDQGIKQVDNNNSFEEDMDSFHTDTTSDYSTLKKVDNGGEYKSRKNHETNPGTK